MQNFKEGDYVRIKHYCSEVEEGEICQLKYGSKSGSVMNKLFAHGKISSCACQDNWELVSETKLNQFNNKIMSVITNIFKSEEDKALEHFELGSKNNLNEKGLMEFLSFLYEQNREAKEGFLAKIVEAYKEKVSKSV